MCVMMSDYKVADVTCINSVCHMKQDRKNLLLVSFCPDLVHLVNEVVADVKDNVAMWVVDHTSPSEEFHSLLDKVDKMSGEALSELPKVDIMSNFLFIFTSGTTGTV